jgi:hypothetical protein
MFDITFRTHGGTTTNSASTFEAAVREAGRILTDQTDQCWSWWADNIAPTSDWLVNGEGRVNGTLTPVWWSMRIRQTA